MTVNLSLLGGAGAQFFNDNGKPLSGGKLYSYAAGTTTPQATYTSSTGATPHSNPIVLDAAGRIPGAGELWVTLGQYYKFALVTSADVPVADWDNVSNGNADLTYYTADPSSLLTSGTVSSALDALSNEQTGSSVVGFLQSGTGAVATTVQSKLREWVSVNDFGADNTGATDCFDAVTTAWTYCLASGKDLYFPAGAYSIKSQNNFPFGRVGSSPPTSLLDCKNITIFGDGPTTTLRTDTVNGADVLQLNGAKNLHFRNLALTATISGTTAGSNAISITGGFDNLTFDHIWCENLPSLDKSTYVDGGSGLSIQTPVAGQTVECGTLKATNIFLKGCAVGFGWSFDAVAASTKDTSVDVEVVAEDCRQGVVVSSGAATAALPSNWTQGLRVKVQTINCMQDLVLARAYGVDVDCQVVTTKTDAARILNYNGVKWFATDTTASVQGLICTYAHKSRVKVHGNKGTCAYKARIGGTTAGSSGLFGATWQSQLHIDLSGTAGTADLDAVDSGGNSLLASKLVVSGETAASIPANFALTVKSNVLEVIGAYGQGVLPGNIRFPAVQVASSDANTLDDYEEGVWTPILANTNLADEGATYVARFGYYTKIGNRVYFTAFVQMSGLGALTTGSAAFVIGLPFASRNVGGNISPCSVSNVSGIALSAAGVMGAIVGANSTAITLRKTLATSTTGDSAMTVGEVSATGVFVISGSYQTL